MDSMGVFIKKAHANPCKRNNCVMPYKRSGVPSCEYCVFNPKCEWNTTEKQKNTLV